jgi:8-oxo-dGTP pyrophosphatase MutT (NUDIX family)
MAELTSGFDDVVCALLIRSKRVLLVHRNESRTWAPNCWDAPGGHVERGESDFGALARELDEELGISVAPGDANVVGRLLGSHFDVRVFQVESWTSEPRNRAPEEHDGLDWFSEEQVADLELADSDLLAIIVTALRADAGAAPL